MRIRKQKIISLVVPPYLLETGKERRGYIRECVTKIALNDFNEESYSKAAGFAPSHCVVTSVTLNDDGVKSLEDYRVKHGLSSRNKAVMAILATCHAKQSHSKKTAMPTFYEAFALIAGYGSKLNSTDLVMEGVNYGR